MGNRLPQGLDPDSLQADAARWAEEIRNIGKIDRAKRAEALAELLRGEIFHADFAFDRASVDEKARTAELSFSSEDPYRRWWGIEVLDHKPGAVRMKRLNDRASLLVNHDADKLVGVIERARIDKDKVGRAIVRFGSSAYAEEIFRDVRDGIRSKTSVGYVIHKLVLEEENDDISTYRATDWEPLEVSIVSVPADATVGVGRALGARSALKETLTVSDTTTAAPAAQETPAAKLSADLMKQNAAVTKAAFEAMATRNKDMQRIAAELDHVPGMKEAYEAAALEPFMTVDAFREVALNLVTKNQSVTKATRTGALEGDRLDRAGGNAWETAEVHHAASVRFFRGVGKLLGRSDAEAAYRAGQFLRVAIFGDMRAAQWCRDAGVQLWQGKFDGARAMGQDVDLRAIGGGVFTSGGWLMPTELSTAIIMNREQYGVARRICNVIPMSSASLSIPRITSGVTAYFVGEGTTGTSSDPAGDQVTLTLKDLMATTQIGKSTAQDSAIPLAEMVANEQARARAVKEDGCLIIGDGTSTYGGIMGIQTLLNAAAYAGGIAAATSGHDTFAEVDATDAAILIGKLPVYARSGARWLCSGVADATIFARLKLGAGGNTVQTVQGQVVEGDYAGFPITIAHDMPTTASNGLIMLALGNFNLGVAFGSGEGMMMTVDPYTRATQNQTVITTVERIDIVAHGVNKSTTVAGPIVGLDATT